VSLLDLLVVVAFVLCGRAEERVDLEFGGVVLCELGVDLCELEVGEVVVAHGEDVVEAVLGFGEVAGREADGGAFVEGGKVRGVALEAVVVQVEGVDALALGERVLGELEEVREGEVGGVVGEGGAGEACEGERDERECAHGGAGAGRVLLGLACAECRD